MIDFDFLSPTKIYFGKEKENEIGKILIERNFTNVLLVYGSSSIKKIGLYEKIIKILDENNIKHCEISNIRPNPSLDKVLEGIKIAKENNVELVLAVGGGSVIDSAKLIADGFYYEGNPFDFNLHLQSPKKALPIGVILTLSASGSELSPSCVISDDKKGIKSGFNSELNRPIFAIMNPELTYSVSKYQTGCGIVDIISHSLERYFCPSGEYEFSDLLALSIIKNTIECGKKCIEEANNYNARAMMMLCGAFSHNGLTSMGKKWVLTVHSIEHALSSFDINIAHGAGLSVLLPGWMEYMYKEDLDKFAKFSEFVFNINFFDKEESAKMGIQYLKKYFKDIGMPITLGELNIKEKDIPTIADKTTINGTRMIGYSSIRPLDRDDVINILKLVI